MLFREHDDDWLNDLDLYQQMALASAIYENPGKNLRYPVLGLCEEAGEVAGNIKKMERDDGGVLTDERRLKLLKELGDVLWYVAAAARELGAPLSEVASMNLEKLRGRKERGTLQGSGDDR